MDRARWKSQDICTTVLGSMTNNGIRQHDKQHPKDGQTNTKPSLNKLHYIYSDQELVLGVRHACSNLRKSPLQLLKWKAQLP